MAIDGTHAAPSMLAAFLASVVEFIEALTIVLAVGAARGWRGALGGTGLALLVLLFLVAVLGPVLTRIPPDAVQLGLGTLLLMFGMRWLRKAILRAGRPDPAARRGGDLCQADRLLEDGRRVYARLGSGRRVNGLQVCRVEKQARSVSCGSWPARQRSCPAGRVASGSRSVGLCEGGHECVVRRSGA
jgi:hypothetical protein